MAPEEQPVPLKQKLLERDRHVREKHNSPYSPSPLKKYETAFIKNSQEGNDETKDIDTQNEPEHLRKQMIPRKGPKVRTPPGPPQTFAAKEKESCAEQEHRHTSTGNNCRRYHQKVATRSDCLREGRNAKNRKRRRAR